MQGIQEKIAYHALAVKTQSSYRELQKLLENFGSWTAASQKINSSAAFSAEHEYEKLEKLGIALLFPDDPQFPPSLREIPWPPFAIYLRGTLPAFKNPTLAIVGTRKATEEGKALAKTFAQTLAEANVVVISGLAFGIDAAAHRGSLDAKGKTLAVLAHGLDQIYPRSHERLAEEILAHGGALLSEYPPGTPSLPYRFLERNRIVSGLASGVLVVEAPEGSGALATARFALEQNRDVFVVPGPARHPNFVGSHALIRNGAELVTKAEDILEALGIEKENGRTEVSAENPVERQIIATLRQSQGALSVDKISEITNLKAQTVNQALTLLILKHAVKETEHGYAV